MLRNKSVWLLQTLIFILTLFSCSQQGKNKNRLLTVNVGMAVQNFSGYPYFFYFYTDSAEISTFPAKNGDLLYIGYDEGASYFRVKPESPDTLTMRKKDGFNFFNDNPWSIELYRSADSPQLFRQLNKNDLKYIQTLFIEDHIRDEFLPFLDSLTEINQQIDLVLSFNITDSVLSTNKSDHKPTVEKNTINYDSFLLVFRNNLEWLSKRFKPELIIFSGPATLINDLQVFKTAEILKIDIKNYSLADSLPALPRLKELIIYDDSGEMLVPEGFLSRNIQLEKLTINGNFNPWMIDWKASVNIHSLHLFNTDTLYSFPYGKTLPKLKSLQLSGSGNLSVNNLSGLEKLKELGIPSALEQGVFNEIIAIQPELEFLHIIESDTNFIKDYTALQNLKHLRYLVISGQNGQSNSLHPLQKLKFLSLPAEFFKDSIQLSALKKALPDTVITPNQGICMGSGWLLLIVPVVALGVVVGRKFIHQAG